MVMTAGRSVHSNFDKRKQELIPKNVKPCYLAEAFASSILVEDY